MLLPISRFSSTVRPVNTSRSSGTYPTPRRTMSGVRSPTSSAPSSVTLPERGTIPRMPRSVVVFPTPLRPNSPVTPPSRTSNETPCKMCDSPK